MPPRDPYRDRTGLHIEWVTVRNRTIYLVGAAVVLLMVAGIGFYLREYGHAAPPADATPVAPSAAANSARFVEIGGTVKVRKAGTYEWIDGNMGVSLDKDDHVRTVGKSTARIRFFDGTEYFMKPDSILVIEDTHEDPSTNVRRVAVKLTAGQVNLQTPRKNVEGSTSELATPTAEASFEELTVADVRYDQSRRVSGFAVYRGGSRLRSGGTEVELRDSQAVDVNADSEFGKVIELPGVPRIDSPAHLAVLPARETTALKWGSVSGARRYRVMVDRSPNFSDPILDSRVGGRTVLVPGLTSGVYFWQVSAIDANNREGGFSDFAKFTITQSGAAAEPPRLLVSEPTVSLDGLVTLQGVTDPDAVVTINEQRVSVKRDGSFRHYFTVNRTGRHAIVVKAHKRSGGVAEKTVYAAIGSDPS